MHALEGIEFDYENGAKMMLRATVDGTMSTRVVPYQLRMLQENRVPKLLPMTCEAVNGQWMLRYDISAKKRLVQMMRVDPPDARQFNEIAYQIAKLISECTMYMLDEHGFVLHEDYLFAGRDLLDIKLCYVPVQGPRKRSVTEDLRCLLLRLYSLTKAGEGYHADCSALFSLLSQEPFSLQQLKNVLQQLRLSEHERTEHKSAHRAPRHSQAWLQIMEKLRSLKHVVKRRETRQEKKLKSGSHLPVGKTEALVTPAMRAEPSLMKIRIRQAGGEEHCEPMMEDRFIIGRNQTGVHYTDLGEGVSRIHCEIMRTETGLEVRDLGSLNGTSLNGEALLPYKSYPFKSGDVLKVVRSEVRLVDEPQSRQPVAQGSRASY